MHQPRHLEGTSMSHGNELILKGFICVHLCHLRI